jgi:hypothetical protein
LANGVLQVSNNPVNLPPESVACIAPAAQKPQEPKKIKQKVMMAIF